MGIKDLKQAINKYCPEKKKKISYSELSGKIIAVDISIYLYKFKYGNRNFLYCFMKQIEKFLKHNIKPIYVFDGKPPPEKNNVINERKSIKKQKYERKEEIEKKIINIENELKDKDKREDKDQISIYNENKKILKSELNKLNMSIINITSNDIKLLKELFNICNIQYVSANTEAELICSQLTVNNNVYGCLTDDTDVLPNRCKNFLTDYNFKNEYLTQYDYSEVLTGLEMSDKEFIDYCILCGCDYTCKIKNLGYITAYKFIHKFKNIETIIENNKEKYNLTDEFIEKYNFQEGRDIFNKNDFEFKIENTENKDIDIESLKTYIKEHSIKFKATDLIFNKESDDEIVETEESVKDTINESVKDEDSTNKIKEDIETEKIKTKHVKKVKKVKKVKIAESNNENANLIKTD